MRNFVLLLACFCITITGFILISCSVSVQTKIQRVSFLIDVTEFYFDHPDTDDLEKLSAISKNGPDVGWGGTTRIVPISELSLNPITEISISPVSNTWLSNEIERKSSITHYWAKIDRAIDSTDGLKKDRDGSAIYASMAREINLLQASQTSNSDQKILLVSSDLMEKSKLADFYLSSTFDEVQNNSRELQRRFMEAYPITSVQGLEIYFIYQPKTPVEADRFEKLTAFYAEIFKGAKIIVVANL